jgi:hypothetical protein
MMSQSATGNEDLPPIILTKRASSGCAVPPAIHEPTPPRNKPPPPRIVGASGMPRRKTLKECILGPMTFDQSQRQATAVPVAFSRCSSQCAQELERAYQWALTSGGGEQIPLGFKDVSHINCSSSGKKCAWSTANGWGCYSPSCKEERSRLREENLRVKEHRTQLLEHSQRLMIEGQQRR